MGILPICESDVDEVNAMVAKIRDRRMEVDIRGIPKIVVPT